MKNEFSFPRDLSHRFFTHNNNKKKEEKYDKSGNIKMKKKSRKFRKIQ